MTENHAPDPVPVLNYSDEPRVPFFSVSGKSPLRTDPVALARFYEDRPLMYRNIAFIGVATLGWGLALGIIGPLMALKMVDLGIGENIQNSIGTVNSGLLAVLVMVFSWTSDHTLSRLGRRKPYFFISAPFIIITILFFPFMAKPNLVWLIIAMQIVYKLFMDLKQSTFSLIAIDCVPRNVLARAMSIIGIISGLAGFIASYKADWLFSKGNTIPYIVAGCVMIVTTTCALLVKEPPIYHPPTEKFKLTSTFKISAQNKRIFILMAGVALVGSYGYSTVLLNIYWANQDLHLNAGQILKAISWAGLVGMALAYPIGWIIDRFGGLRVVIAYFILSTAAFFFQLHVHDTTGLIQLAIAGTFFGGLYGAADIMVYKSCPEEDVGSITSTNAFMRNLCGMGLGFLFTWVPYFFGTHVNGKTQPNYHAGYITGEVFSAIGMMLFFVYAWTMRNYSKETGIPMRGGIPDTTELPMPDGMPAPDGLLLRDGVLFPSAVEDAARAQKATQKAGPDAPLSL